MIPILYQKNASDFSNNGIGILKDAISCEVSEERNGSYSLTMKYPISGNWFSSIGEGSILKAKPNESSELQLFRIRKSSKPIKGTVTFYADHISYDLSGLPVMGLTMASTTPGAVMTEALESSPIKNEFKAWSNIGTLNRIDITEPRSARALIGGKAGSVLSIWGGELEFDNFTIKLHSSRGRDNGVILNYGKNITDAKQERNIESCYTHFCPYAVKTVNTTNESGEIIDQKKITVTLAEKIIELVDPHDIGHKRALILDMSEKFGEGEDITEANLRIKAKEYIESHKLGTPAINITVKFVQIWDTPEYESFAALERVRLCDIVTVRFEELGISASAKVIKTVYDVLKERYSSIEVGSAKESLADSFESVEGQIKETSEIVLENKSAQEVALNNAIIEATNKITGNAGGYVVLHPANYPSEILIMNTNDINTATKVWRWNSSGLGYSSTGYSGTYGLAMTIDGSIVADYINAGTLTAINISGCTISGGSLNIGSGKFQVDSSGNIHAEGFIKATSGEIGGCSIVNGVLQVTAANIEGTLTAINLSGCTITGGSISINDKFTVDAEGNIRAEGEIIATSGIIGGCEINDGILKIKNANISEKITAETVDVAGVIKAGGIAVLGDVEIETKRATEEEGALSSRITATAEEISSEVTRAKGAETSLSSRITQNAEAITAKVNSSGGSSSSFGWSLTSSGFYLYSDGKTVMKSTSSGLEVIGKITANSGSFAGSIVATNDISSENKTLINEHGIYFGNPFNADTPSYIGASDYSINNEGGEWAMKNITIYSAPKITVTEDAWESGLWYLKGWTITPDKISLRASYNGNDGTTITKNGTISASDRNVKNSIDLFSDKYDVFFDNLIPRIYKYNHDTDNQVHSGYIAQEVDNALKVAGLTRKNFAALCVEREGNSKEKWGLMYDEFISLNTWQIQKLKARIERIEKILFNL